MNKSIWLQRQIGGAVRLDSVKGLFGGLKSIKAIASSNGEPLAAPAASEEPIILLQEGADDPYSLKRKDINAGLYRFRQYSSESMTQRWQAARLRTDPLMKDERLYLVQCLDYQLLCWRRVNPALEPISSAYTVQRDNYGMIVHNGKELSELTLRALETTAARALYALWLDAGSVLVAVSGTGSLAVRNAWSIEEESLPYDDDLLQLALTQWIEGWEADTGQSFLIGADPELLLTDQQGKLVSASSMLDDMISEEIGIDALLYKNKLIYPIVELRPYPVREPARLLASLRRLLKQLDGHIVEHNLQMLAGGMPVQGVALGGHLHISGIPYTPRLMRLLDANLALPFAALLDERGKHRYDKFGGLGDFRKQFHGGFEYRTLPSWLVSPALAQAAIYACWLTISERNKLAESLLDVVSHEQVYTLANQAQLAAEALKSIELLMNLARDQQAAARLAPLRRALEQSKVWDELQDIRLRWLR